MKIHWKRVLIAGIWSEAVLLAIYLPLLQHYQRTGTMFYVLTYLDFIVLMFLGGLWAVRKVEFCFILHGVLVGIVAQAIWGVLVMVRLLLGASPDQPPPGSDENLTIALLIGFFRSFAIKVLGSAAGGYVGGRLKKKTRIDSGK